MLTYLIFQNCPFYQVINNDAINATHPTVNKNENISIRPNANTLNSVGSNSLSGNLPTPIRAFNTSIITETVCR